MRRFAAAALVAVAAMGVAVVGGERRPPPGDPGSRRGSVGLRRWARRGTGRGGDRDRHGHRAFDRVDRGHRDRPMYCPHGTEAPDLEAAQLASDVVMDWDLTTAVVIAIVAETGRLRRRVRGPARRQVATPTSTRPRSSTGASGPRLERCDPMAACDRRHRRDHDGADRGRHAARANRPPTAGPPFPEPELDRAVYDQAGDLRAGDDRYGRGDDRCHRGRGPGAEVVVYSQVVDYGITTEEADKPRPGADGPMGRRPEGVRRRPGASCSTSTRSLVHGQVQLYGGPGYRAAFLDNSEKTADLRRGHAAAAARRRTSTERSSSRSSESTKPRRPNTRRGSRLARQLDAVVGLIGAPIILIGLVGRRRLRPGSATVAIPSYLDDPSIHMAGPAAGPDAGRGRVRHRRPAQPPCADDGHARPRQPRPASRSARRRRCSG